MDNRLWIDTHTHSNMWYASKEPTIDFWRKESHLADLLEFFKGVVVCKNKSNQAATHYHILHKAFTKKSEENLSWHGIKGKFIKSLSNHLKEQNKE